MIAIVVAALLGGTATLVAPASVYAFPKTSMQASDAIVATGDTTTLTVTAIDDATGDPLIGALVKIYVNGATKIGEGTTDGDGRYAIVWTVPFGAHQITGIVEGFQTSRSEDLIVIGQGASTVTLSLLTPAPIVAGKSVTFQADAWNVENDSQANYGTIKVRDLGTGLVIGTGDADGEPFEVFIFGGLTGGTHQLVAEFAGLGDIVLPSVSPVLVVDVQADTVVQADTPKLGATSFYPVTDGYKDTMSTTGRIAEGGSVKLEVWTVASNTKVRTLDLGANPTSFSYTGSWNGRRTDGSLASAGSYRFVHRLTDLQGNTRSFTTSSFTLSHKKLYWYTIDTVIKQGRAYAIKGYGSSGSVSTSSSFSGGLKLSGNGSWAGIVYRFDLSPTSFPSSAVTRRITFSVLGKGISSGRANIGIYNETLGEIGSTASYDAKITTTSTYTWHKTSTASIAPHLYGTRVYAMVTTRGIFDINDVKAEYKYALLK